MRAPHGRKTISAERLHSGMMANDGAAVLMVKTGDRLDGSPLVLLLDVDGTLAPIASQPDQAAVPPATLEVLRRIASLPGVVVAFVSGRSAADAWRIAGVPGAWVLGNHGFEMRDPSGVIVAADAALPQEQAIADAAVQLESAARDAPGAVFENKRWTLSLHYRMVEASAVPALVRRAKAVAESLGLRVTEGKKVIEIRPQARVDKGTASVEFAGRFGALEPRGSLLYVGDDRTDEDAFAALRERGRRPVTVRIGAPGQGEPASTAEFALSSPEALRDLLEQITERRSLAARTAEN